MEEAGMRRVQERAHHALLAQQPVTTYKVGQPKERAWDHHWVGQPINKVRSILVGQARASARIVVERAELKNSNTARRLVRVQWV